MFKDVARKVLQYVQLGRRRGYVFRLFNEMGDKRDRCYWKVRRVISFKVITFFSVGHTLSHIYEVRVPLYGIHATPPYPHLHGALFEQSPYVRTVTIGTAPLKNSAIAIPVADRHRFPI